MFVYNVVLIAFAISPAVNSANRNLASISTCRASEFTCLDGTCISADAVCDNYRDCPDGSDEASCYSSSNSNHSATEFHERYRRQTSCGQYKWQCADGTCIDADGKCDGKVDCPDKSDETHARCRNTKCQANLFRCTYGACVDGTAPCNKINECADESDELLPKCRNENRLKNGKFQCQDGSTISATDHCDGIPNCPDGSDETVRTCAGRTCPKHLFQCAYGACVDQGSDCNGYKWQCADGTCIDADGKCDGKVDCPDKSDETHARCRNTKCQANLFRCTYGACVDGTAPCNKINECADESDELLPKCRNENRLKNGKFQCQDGSTISATDHCDGIPNCPDGSDETVRTCAGRTCPKHLFQCAYGACVDQGSDCNGRKECADGSDESVELCSGMLPANTQTTGPTIPGQCLLPRYPEHGTYVVENAPYATPGQNLPYANVNITCDPGYGVAGGASAYCLDGNWQIKVQNCVPFCSLDPDVSVQYNCEVKNTNGYRICNNAEPSGTIVNAVCNNNYEPRDQSGSMKCRSDGRWNRIVKCKPVCGRVTPIGKGQVSGGTIAHRAEVPWHVAIYLKPTREKPSYNQICGGSMVSDRIVLSAAHCFWDKDKGVKIDASNFAVATGKLYREWNHKDDKDAQTSEIKSLDIAPHYLHSRTNYQHDIAVLTLKTPFEYFNYVRPVCLDFDYFFNVRQLRGGALGKVAGWGLTTRDGPASPILKVVQLPVIPFDNCTQLTPESFTENITADKICAGYSDGTAAVCPGDSGGGLSFPAKERGKIRYYLRGIVSTAPRSDYECNTDTITTFTEVYQHKDFINKFL